jgi:hypothetical protein
MTQGELADAVDSSHRTVGRWEAERATPAPHHLENLAKLVYPVDRNLAAELAHYAGQTFLSLGLELPPAPPAPVPVPVPVPAAPAPPAPHAKPSDLVDILVLAGMLETGHSAQDVRRWLHAVVKRGCDVGLSMGDAELGLRTSLGFTPGATAQASQRNESTSTTGVPATEST